eukprot:24035_1
MGCCNSAQTETSIYAQFSDPPSPRPQLKTPFCSYVDALYDMGDEYWRVEIQEWIDDDEIKMKEYDSNSDNPKETGTWMEFEKYIQALYNTIKQECKEDDRKETKESTHNQYRKDKWEIIQHYLWQLRKQSRNQNISSLKIIRERAKTMSSSKSFRLNKSNTLLKKADTMSSLHLNTLNTPNTKISKEHGHKSDNYSESKMTEVKKTLLTIIKDKDTIQLAHESENHQCCVDISDHKNKAKQLAENCECFKRLEIVLSAYHKIMNTQSDWTNISIANHILIADRYEHQQLSDDFAHVKIIHIDADNKKYKTQDQTYSLAHQLCLYLEGKYQCKSTSNCKAFLRHYKHQQSRVDINTSTRTSTSNYNSSTRTHSHYGALDIRKFSKYIEDAACQQDCDKIHAYFFHSTIKFGNRESYKINLKVEEEIDDMNQVECFQRFVRNKSSSQYCDDESEDEEKQSDNNLTGSKKCYVGKKEDNLWWNEIEKKRNKDEIYHTLVANMGVFRSQNAHGFGPEKNQAISQYQAMFKNIKEEILYNAFEYLPPDSWNQTLRKSSIFLRSWAAKKIRTKYNGYYDDGVTRQKEEWKEGEEIDIEAIVTLKLYTDFDKLQFALKKCFRHETIRDILKDEKNISTPQSTWQKK